MKTYLYFILIIVSLLGFNIPSSTFAQTLPYENSRFGIFAAYAANEFDNFIRRMNFNDNQYWNWADHHAKNLGAHWTRSNLQLAWDFIEPTIDSAYNWNPVPFMTDSIITHIYHDGNQVHWLGVFHEGGLFGQKPNAQKQLRDPMIDTVRYKRFVRDAVERYDGDGYLDVNNFVHVKYWQIGNEVPFTPATDSKTKYASWVRLTAAAIHSADSSAKIALIAPTQGFNIDPWLHDVIIDLSHDTHFDVIDVHHWGRARDYKFTGVRQTRKLLDSLQLKDVQIWSCENGTWAYQPSTPPVFQTQEEQARSLIQRYVYNIDFGLNKLFWENLVEWFDFNGDQNSVWNSMGLIGDGMRNGEPINNFNKPRVSYYAYKMLAEAIDVDKARYAGKMNIHNEPNLFAYRFISLSTDSSSRFILWRDNTSSLQSIHINSPRARVTNMITDSLGNILHQDIISADGQGNISVLIGFDPILVEELPGTSFISEKNVDVPLSITLNQNYPNPFNSRTHITFTITNYGNVTLKVFDMLGREVTTLVDAYKQPGTYTVTFDTQELLHSTLLVGNYFYRINSLTFSQTKIMNIVR